MMTRSRPFALAVSVLLVSGAAAGPLDKSRVPADVSWLVHLDAEAVLRSSVVRFVMENDKHVDLDELDDIKNEFGIDPLTDFKDATVFGTDTDGGDAVAIVTTTPAVDGAIEKLRGKGLDIQIIKEGSYDLFSWTDNGHTQYGFVRDAGKDERLVYLSKDKSRLVAAAEVGKGRGESLRGKKDSALSADPGAGAMLFVATDVMPSDHGHGQASMVLEKAKALRLEIGEDGNDCYAKGRLTMASSEDATDVVDTFQGLQAIARMFCRNNPDLAPLKELLNAESVEAKDDVIVAQLRYPTARLIDALKAAEAAEDRDGDDDQNGDDEDDGHAGDDGDDDAGHKHHKGHHDKGPL